MTRSSVRTRLCREDGFTMLYALGIMLVVMLLTAAVFTTVQSDAYLSGANLNGKRAYSAAQAGLQAYLGQLNENAASSSWWQTCSNDTATNVAVPGTSGESYSYQPVVSGCATSGALGTVVDPSVGLLRMEFTGKAGGNSTSANFNGATRTIVADFRPNTPLAFLWYTVHETLNPALDSNCPNNSSTFLWNSNVPSECDIYWVSGNAVNGPMYTQDEFLVSGAPTFGRSSSTDPIETPAPSVCVGGCPSGVIQGKAIPNGPTIPLPSDNASLATNASTNGIVLPAGTTTLNLSVSGSQTNATAVTCTTSVAAACTTKTYTNVGATPVIYAPTSGTGSGCTTYTPSNVSYSWVSGGNQTNGPFYGPCGDLYVQGTYNAALTIAAQNDVVVMQGGLLNSADTNGQTTPPPTNSALLGIVANAWVRVMHPVNNPSSNSCTGTSPNLTIDAAILALNDSFYVDNYDCGNPGTLTVHGSIAQEYRGAVSTGGGSVSTGYLKNYVYDGRLKYSIPPYMFNLQNTSWTIVRETLCGAGIASTNFQSCSYTGNAG